MIMKKNALFIIFLFAVIIVRAQTNGAYTNQVDERLKHLNKSLITSNILIDRVFPDSRIQGFNQGNRSDISNSNHLKQAWSELYRASYIKNFSSIEDLESQVKSKNYGTDIVPIGIINTEFHLCNFGTTAANTNVNFNPVTGHFTNKSGKNPFLKKHAIAISPLVAEATGNSIRFTTDNIYRLHKQGKRIKTLRLYTNGTSFTLIHNYSILTSNHTTSYSSSGEKTLKFEIIFSDNSTKTTYAKISIYKPINYLQKSTNSSNLKKIEAKDDLLFKGYDESKAYRGLNEYRIYYDAINGDQIVNKPLYIIDGYDPDDNRKIEKADYDKFDPIKNETLYDLMKYKNGSTDIELIKQLQGKGFDVIVVNHPVYKRGSKVIDGGSDYIERNAYTFISLIREIKGIQQGTAKAVVIGPSMGGLISRYALAYMEKKFAQTGEEKWNHNTRLWVSFDTPHQGANVPIGVQKGVEYLGKELGIKDAKDFINNQLNKPAPKQMLVNHYSNNTSLPVGAPNFRNRFQNNLNALGMPKNLRKVALINGSLYGKHNGTSGAQYLKFDDKLTHIASIVPILPSIFADRFIANFYHTLNNKSGTHEEFTFDGGVKGKFLWWTWWTTRQNYKSRPKAKGSYDIGPGGYYNAQQIVVDKTKPPKFGYEPKTLSWILHNLKTYLYDPTHGFIPSKSALDYSGSIVLDEFIADKNRVCTGETPFDSYYGPKNNEGHIQLSKDNVNWLLKEIEGIPQNPALFIQPFAIAGDHTICNSEYKTYTINKGSEACQGNTTWTVNNHLTIISKSHSSITVKPSSGSFSGIGIITATREGTNKVIDQRGIWIGKPFDQFANFRVAGGAQIYTRRWTRFEALSTYLIPQFEDELYTFDFEWSITNSQIRFANNKQIANVYPNFSGNFNIGLRLKNRCGCTNWNVRQFNATTINTGGGGPGGNTELTPAF